jgi:hypothetical protein
MYLHPTDIFATRNQLIDIFQRQDTRSEYELGHILRARVHVVKRCLEGSMGNNEGHLSPLVPS